MLIFCIFHFVFQERKNGDRGREKKEEAVAAVAAADKEACRGEVAAKELSAIKSDKEKEKMPRKYARQYGNKKV